MQASGLRALTQTQAAEIMARYNTGKCSQRELAKRFGVSQGTISNIVTSRFYVMVQKGHMKPGETLIDEPGPSDGADSAV